MTTIKKASMERLTSESRLKNGEKFELSMVIAYDASRYYPTKAYSQSGDLVAKGVHYQVKANRGMFEHVSDKEQLKARIMAEKSTRFLLEFNPNTSKGKGLVTWLDLEKQQVLELIDNTKFFQFGFYNGNTDRPVARWIPTEKKSRTWLERFSSLKII